MPPVATRRAAALAHPAPRPSAAPRTHLLHAAVLVAGLLAVAGDARAQLNVDLTLGPVDYTTWQLFGSATAQNSTPGNGFTYSVLTLTQTGTNDQAGAAFAPQALQIDFNQPFAFHFNWYIPVSQGLRGDGLTFTLATQPGVGGGGTGLGYEFLDSRSVAMAIDTFHFDDEPVSPSVQILAGGNYVPLAAMETGLGDAIRDPDFQWFGRFRYTPSGNDDNTGTLEARIEHLNLGSFSVQSAVDFSALQLVGADLYYGFTAANGVAIDGHATSWGAPVPVPEPGSWVLMGAGLLAIGRLARRRGG